MSKYKIIFNQKARIIDRFFEKGFNWVNRSFLGSVLIKALCAIAIALLIAYLTNVFTTVRQNKEDILAQQTFVSTVGIGSNKEYVDSILGYPYQAYVDSFSLIEDCCYQIKDAQFRAFYVNNVLKGFIVVLQSSEGIGSYRIDYIKWGDSFNKTVGEYQFDEIFEEFGDKYCGHYGAMYQMYPHFMEEYYIPGCGIPCYAVFAVLPDGIFIPPEITYKNDVQHYDGMYWQWGGNYANAWGLLDSAYDTQICSLIFNNEVYQENFFSLYDTQERDYLDKKNVHTLHVYYKYDMNYVSPPDPNWFGDEIESYINNLKEEIPVDEY